MTTISVPNAKAPDQEALEQVAKGSPVDVQVLGAGVTLVFDGDLDEETRMAVIQHVRDAQRFLTIEAPTLDQVIEQVRRLTRALEG